MNSLDPEQDPEQACFVAPDLGPNCLQRLSADYKCRRGGGGGESGVVGGGGGVKI